MTRRSTTILIGRLRRREQKYRAFRFHYCLDYAATCQGGQVDEEEDNIFHLVTTFDENMVNVIVWEPFSTVNHQVVQCELAVKQIQIIKAYVKRLQLL